ncbi:MAG: hypothetical protein HY897_09380 [Deltaproteobacteria bacterium]|nr:hypothetical protein [Deltaproteobacteria bacterium]
MADVEQKECPNCGAPLSPAPGQTHVTCEFCGNALEVKLSKEERQKLHEERERRLAEERERREREEEEKRRKEAQYIRPEQTNTARDMGQIMGQVGQAVNLGGVVQNTVRTAVSTVITGCLLAGIVMAGIVGLIVYLVLKA